MFTPEEGLFVICGAIIIGIFALDHDLFLDVLKIIYEIILIILILLISIVLPIAVGVFAAIIGYSLVIGGGCIAWLFAIIAFILVTPTCFYVCTKYVLSFTD